MEKSIVELYNERAAQRRTAIDISELLDKIIDIASSGSVGEITDSEWRVQELENLRRETGKVNKDEFMKELQAAIEQSEGWYVNDIKYLEKLFTTGAAHDKTIYTEKEQPPQPMIRRFRKVEG